jgi:hypothetical protein
VVGVVLTVILLVNAPLQLFGTADWTDAVGAVVFLALLAWVFVLSVVFAVSLRREAVAVSPDTAAT